jgi:hypothetical protein
VYHDLAETIAPEESRWSVRAGIASHHPVWPISENELLVDVCAHLLSPILLDST